MSMNTSKSNIDYNEIKKFEASASLWWDTEGKFKTLHNINHLRFNYITHRSGGLFGKKVLDVGCGGGILAESIAREGAQVTGLDMSAKQLKVAHLHALKNGFIINYIQQTVEDHAKQHIETYDIVVCMEMLEHVPNPRSVVQACAKLVKPGGEVFFSTINRNIKSCLMVILGAEYIMRIVPIGTHDIKKFIQPAELITWVGETLLYEKHIIGLHYNPFTSKFCLAPGVDINYILHTHHGG